MGERSQDSDGILAEAGGTGRYSARVGRSKAGGMQQRLEQSLHREIEQKERSLERFRIIHRPTVAALFVILISGFLKSDFMDLAENSIANAIQYSQIITEELVQCIPNSYGVFQYDGMDCGPYGSYKTKTLLKEWVDLKWFCLLIGVLAFSLNELFRFKNRKLRQEIRAIKKKYMLNKRTHDADFQEVMERFQVGLAECPDCGRNSRVPPKATVLVTCGACGAKWVSRPNHQTNP